MIITYFDIILFIAGQFKKALSTRGGDDVRHIKINEPQTVKYTGNAIGMLFLNTIENWNTPNYIPGSSST